MFLFSLNQTESLFYFRGTTESCEVETSKMYCTCGMDSVVGNDQCTFEGYYHPLFSSATGKLFLPRGKNFDYLYTNRQVTS